MQIREATAAYEAWAGKRIDLVAEDLRLKHRRMAEAAFLFMRATFYSWVGLWHEACPELAAGPRILAVGDLHVENFGTWRDAEGRLAWGVNDFDEAFPMPYAIDLVRLATSALLAIREERLAIGADDAAAAILAGYSQGIAGATTPFVLEESHPSLRAMALGAERDPQRFWSRMTAFKPATPPGRVRQLLQNALPDAAEPMRILHRIAGLGSLGRPRYVALAQSAGGLVAREAKAMLPSAYAWALRLPMDRLYYEAIVARSLRPPDPFLRVRKGWLLRRLGPHCSRIELDHFPKQRDERHILTAMGQETGNVHLGSPAAIAAIRRDLKRRGTAWLKLAAERMAEATIAEWKLWRKSAR
jgi:hypothetical protein